MERLDMKQVEYQQLTEEFEALKFKLMQGDVQPDAVADSRDEIRSRAHSLPGM